MYLPEVSFEETGQDTYVARIDGISHGEPNASEYLSPYSGAEIDPDDLVDGEIYELKAGNKQKFIRVESTNPVSTTELEKIDIFKKYKEKDLVDLPFDNVDYVASLFIEFIPKLDRSFLDVIDNKAFGFDEGYYQIGFNDDTSVYGYYNGSDFDKMDKKVVRNQILRKDYNQFPDDIQQKLDYVFNPDRIGALVYYLVDSDKPLPRGQSGYMEGYGLRNSGKRYGWMRSGPLNDMPKSHEDKFLRTAKECDLIEEVDDDMYIPTERCKDFYEEFSGEPFLPYDDNDESENNKELFL